VRPTVIESASPRSPSVLATAAFGLLSFSAYKQHVLDQDARRIRCDVQSARCTRVATVHDEAGHACASCAAILAGAAFDNAFGSDVA